MRKPLKGCQPPAKSLSSSPRKRRKISSPSPDNEDKVAPEIFQTATQTPTAQFSVIRVLEHETEETNEIENNDFKIKPSSKESLAIKHSKEEFEWSSVSLTY